jgi:AcrR family transcriptional regulator
MNDDRRDERRQMLLDAAKEVIVRYGYRKATLEDVARAAKVSRATLYNYFDNKQELAREIIVREINSLRQVLAESQNRNDPPEQRLLALVNARYRRLRQLRHLYSVALEPARDVLPVAVAEMEAFRLEQASYLRALIEEGVELGRFRNVDIDTLTAALLSALRGLDEGFMFEDRDALAAGAELLVRTLLTGLLVNPAGDSP